MQDPVCGMAVSKEKNAGSQMILAGVAYGHNFTMMSGNFEQMPSGINWPIGMVRGINQSN